MSAIAEFIRLMGFSIYRYILTDLLPGLTAVIVGAYYLREIQGVRDFALDFRFIIQIGGGWVFAILLLCVTVSVGLILNLLTGIVFGRIIGSKRLLKIVANLDRPAGYKELQSMADYIIEQAREYPAKQILDPDKCTKSPIKIEMVRNFVGLWLSRHYPDDYRRIDRYSGAAIMCRSMASIFLFIAGVEAYRHIASVYWGTELVVFPIVSVLFLFASSYVFAYRTRMTLQAGNQRFRELAWPPKENDIPQSHPVT
jgi:hypothetical protein